MFSLLFSAQSFFSFVNKSFTHTYARDHNVLFRSYTLNTRESLIEMSLVIRSTFISKNVNLGESFYKILDDPHQSNIC